MTHMSCLQAQGMATNAVRTHPANLPVQSQQAQQQSSSQLSAIQHQYAPDLVNHQAQMTQPESLGPVGGHTQPNLTGSSVCQSELKQSVSPPVSSQTANFSRFNLSAMPSSRKPCLPAHPCQ